MMAAPPMGVVYMASSGEVALRVCQQEKQQSGSRAAYTISVVESVGSGKATSGADGGVTMTAITGESAFRGDNLVVVERDLRDVVDDFFDVVDDFFNVVDDLFNVVDDFFDVILDVLDDFDEVFDGVDDVLDAGLEDDVDVCFDWVVGGIVEGGVEIGGCVVGVKSFN
jgi:hypothetical protein